MSYLWSYSPDEPKVQERKEYRPAKKPRVILWIAPEHARIAQSMGRDYPRNDRGEKLEGTERRLVIDKRPTVLIPPRKTRLGWK